MPRPSGPGQPQDLSWGVFKCREDAIGSPLGDVSGLDVVELGCGTAYFSAQLAYRGARPVGVDPTPAQLATARRMMERAGISFPLVEAPGERVPLPDASFDLAVSEFGASLWADPALWVPEAARLLRPGGRLVFLTNSFISYLCAIDEGGTSETLQRPQFGAYRMQWPGETGIEYHLAHGDWIDLLRGERLRDRAAHRAEGAAGGAGARVLRLRHAGVGVEVAGRGDLGGSYVNRPRPGWTSDPKWRNRVTRAETRPSWARDRRLTSVGSHARPHPSHPTQPRRTDL